LAQVLETLARQGSVDSFYRGDIAQRIADDFRRHGGLVTTADLAAYRAREVEPLALSWNGCSIQTAPLTAGGATAIQALRTLKEVGWNALSAADPAALHALVEALRLAWDDRLRFLGDPSRAKVPLERLLSARHAERSAEQVRAAVRDRKPLAARTDGRPADGTVHLSAVDGNGMMVSLTLTHGSSFGAQVVVDGLGLVLGHGMSRFDPHPDHPNAPGPAKRPLHNMCPTIVLRDQKPVMAVGASGGRKIVNAVFAVLAETVGRGAPLDDAVAVPRVHTEGELKLVLTPKSPPAGEAYLRELGYTVSNGPVATVSAVTV
jgi:gamma-glutamyltranspeptidase/glutathione hydrolase